MTIKIDGVEYIPTFEKPKAAGVEMWYDRHCRHWVLYPVDAEGTQIAEATYGFNRAEAKRIKAELQEEWKI